MTLKILSDFDGVWTDPTPEADAVRAELVRRTAELSGVESETVAADMIALSEIALGSPAQHGWTLNGRITAFADEDPLILGNAVTEVIGMIADHSLDGRTPAIEVVERCTTYRAAILDAGHPNLDDFAEWVFRTGTANFRQGRRHALLPAAIEVAERLLRSDAEVVVVSNSGEEKILDWFDLSGIPAKSVNDREAGDDRCLYVRGSAGKFVLGEGSEQVELCGRKIYIDRPMYRAAIEAEAPDLVVGDVFSLDLALPHALRCEGHPWAPSQLVLRRNSYSPAWAADERAGGVIDHVIDELAGLCDLIEA